MMFIISASLFVSGIYIIDTVVVQNIITYNSKWICYWGSFICSIIIIVVINAGLLPQPAQ